MSLIDLFPASYDALRSPENPKAVTPDEGLMIPALLTLRGSVCVTPRTFTLLKVLQHALTPRLDASDLLAGHGSDEAALFRPIPCPASTVSLLCQESRKGS